MYRYKLYRTNSSSTKFGNCEVCGSFVNEVYHLVEERKYTIPKKLQNILGREGWTRHNCIDDTFGHEECLKKLIKQPSTVIYSSRWA